jgi:hypothetical protein
VAQLVGTVTRLPGGQPQNCIAVHSTGNRFFLCRNVQTGSGAHPVSYLMGTGDTFTVVKRPECDAGHFHLKSTLGIGGAKPPIPYIPSWNAA